MLDVRCEEHLAQVRAFAKEIGKADQLENLLTYLGTYAEFGDKKTRCVLCTDFAPHDFRFTMWRVACTYTNYEYHCAGCGEEWCSPSQKYDGDRCVTCEGTYKIRGSHRKDQAEQAWFSGGLIYHESDGWSVHT